MFLKNQCISHELNRAHELFDRISQPDFRSLTRLISAYTELGKPKESLILYTKLRKGKHLKPDKPLLLSAAKACAAASDLLKAKEIHLDVIRFGLRRDLSIGNRLVDVYGKCGRIDEARKVFDEMPDRDVVSWTSLITACVNCRLPSEALGVFSDMILAGVRPNSVTLSMVFSACSDLKILNCGKAIHCFAMRRSLEDNAFVSSGLQDMYAKCLNIQQARIIFDRTPRKDVVSWNVMLAAYFLNGYYEEGMSLFILMKAEGARVSSDSWNCMISGCAKSGNPEQAFEVFAKMQKMGCKPNKVTIACILPACTDLESLRNGREIHGYIVKHRFVEEIILMTALMLMYAKSGDLEKSRILFSKMPRKDTVAWNTMILANSMHGCSEEALVLFHQMIYFGVRPNSATFMAVLSGCSHSQLTDEGREIFNSMSRDHDIIPDADHYACMVDVLSRSGHVKEAYEFIQNMPMEPTASAWGALLSACRVYKNVELGKIAAARLFDIEPKNPGNYLLLSSILMSAGMWNDALKIKALMRDRGLTKTPGCSWIQIKNKVYTFVKGDDQNAWRDEIYKFLREINEKMKGEGYIPSTDIVVQDVDREEKEESLCSHSEKLAVAFGVLNLNGESNIRVFKNLRTCGDCHNVIKFIAGIMKLKIVVRDNVRFHHFSYGICSCRDLW